MIRNRETLCDHGDADARRDALGVATHALAQAHPDVTVPSVVSRTGADLRIDGTHYDLTDVENVYVVGAGKGSLAVVRALRDVLGDALTDGIVVEKRGQGGDCPGVEVCEAGHPLPDEDGVRATERLLALVRSAGESDLVVACITGGASALLPAPAGGLALDDLRETTDRLLRAGLPIEEINTVRRHLSGVKGGQLTRRIAPARTVALVVVDEVAGEPWGPTTPDETTVGDAVAVLRDRDLWSDVPDAVRDHLTSAAETGWDTPTAADLSALRTQTVILADATDAAEAAREKARELGYASTILSTAIEGESREVGTVLAGVATEIRRHGRPVEPPCVVVTGGETTVRVEGEAGRGGPNQELAVSFARAVRGNAGTTLLSLGTDGTDGPTAAAGGLVDGESAVRADAEGLDLLDHLRRHDSTSALEALDDVVVTGATGTNVMDLRVLVVTSSSAADE